jgi:hypothetical protein
VWPTFLPFRFFTRLSRSLPVQVETKRKKERGFNQIKKHLLPDWEIPIKVSILTARWQLLPVKEKRNPKKKFLNQKSVGGECRFKCHVTCDYDVSQRLDAFQQRAGISKI